MYTTALVLLFIIIILIVLYDECPSLVTKGH